MRQLEDEAHIRVRNEELRIGAVDDHGAHVRIGLDLAAEAIHLEDQRQVEEIDRRVVDGGARDPIADAYP